MLMAAVRTRIRLEALKFLLSMVTGMPIITATFWKVSMASAGCFPPPSFRFGGVCRKNCSLDVGQWEFFQPLGEGSIGQACGHMVRKPHVGGGWDREETCRIEGWWRWGCRVSHQRTLDGRGLRGRARLASAWWR